MRVRQNRSRILRSSSGLSSSALSWASRSAIENLENRILLAAKVGLDIHDVAENLPIGTVVGTLSVPGATGETFSFMTNGGGDPGDKSFTIDGNLLKTAEVFDFETQSSYHIRVVAVGSVNTSTHMTITIDDVNEVPTDITLTGGTIPTNSPIGTVAGTLSTVDADVTDTFTYALIAGTGDTDNGMFQIVGNQLQLNGSISSNTLSTFSILVQSTDSDGLTTQKAFTITATPVNEAPTDLSIEGTTVAENSPLGTAIGTFTTTDPDAGDTFTYALVAGTGDTDNGLFQIVGDQLQLNGPVNFEAQSSFSILVQSTDSGGLTTQKAFTITATDVNEAPTDLALAGSTVPEFSAVGTVVGTLSSTDVDAGDTATYTLVSGAGDTDNSQFQIVGNQLQVNGSLDASVQNTRSILVRVTDSGGLSYDKQFTVDATLVTGPLVINGTANGDTISIQNDGTDLVVDLNGTVTHYLLARITSLTVNGLGGSDTITLGDSVMGTTINGGAGDDSITGGAGGNQINGGDGNDSILAGAGNDTVSGGKGSDFIKGGVGDDVLIGGVDGDVIRGGVGNDTVDAGTGADSIWGGEGNDSLLAGTGFDLVRGGSGDDYVRGGLGGDTIFGGDGNDTLFGKAGSDLIYGGAGDDMIDVAEPTGGMFLDTVYGGPGNDSVNANAGDTLIDVETEVIV